MNGAKANYEADFLVNTRATDCMVPAAELHKAGIKPLQKMTYELADGTLKEYPFGIASIELMGEVTAGRIIFGPDDADPFSA